MGHKDNRRFRRGCVIFLLAAAVAQTAALTAHASRQGRLGKTSSGSVTITLVKHATVSVSGTRDMAVNAASAKSGVLWTNDICVYTSLATGGYTVVASGAPSAGGAFVLSNGAGTIPYNINWNAGGAGNLSNSGVPLNPGVQTPPLGNAATGNATCKDTASGATARLIVNVPQSALQTASPGSYTESLTLLMSPN